MTTTTTTKTTKRPEGCLSDFALDSQLAGELEAAEAAAAEAHIAECTHCTKRIATLTAEREQFAKSAPPLRLPLHAVAKAKELAKRSFFSPSVIGAFALAAALLLFFTIRGQNLTGGDVGDGDPLGAGVRTKGSDAKLGFYVKRGADVRLGGPNEAVQPGDTLRFVVTAREERWVAVLSVDGEHHVSVYYPSEKRAPRVAPGNEIALPQSTALDDTLGNETIHGVFCGQPFDVEPLRSALEKRPTAPPPLPMGCSVDTLRVHKERSPTP